MKNTYTQNLQEISEFSKLCPDNESIDALSDYDGIQNYLRFQPKVKNEELNVEDMYKDLEEDEQHIEFQKRKESMKKSISDIASIKFGNNKEKEKEFVNEMNQALDEEE